MLLMLLLLSITYLLIGAPLPRHCGPGGFLHGDGAEETGLQQDHGGGRGGQQHPPPGAAKRRRRRRGGHGTHEKLSILSGQERRSIYHSPGPLRGGETILINYWCVSFAVPRSLSCTFFVGGAGARGAHLTIYFTTLKHNFHST